MPAILLHLVAAALYMGLALHFWRTRWRGPALDRPPAGPDPWERACLLAALVVHGITLAQEIFPGDAMRFGFSAALSMILWLAIALYWIESFYARMEGLQMLGLPLAAVGALLPSLLPGQHVLANADSPVFRAHFLMAMLAYSLFTLAALHAILMAVAEKRLHRGRLTPLFTGLPPLLTMEALLFRLIHIAFILLTLTLVSGIAFSETLFGKALSFNHKTVFAILSWLIFAALLAGRHLRGWRGRTALRWTLAGFAALLLAYVGSRFVLEVILGRPA
ncbi:MAG: cytochrome c biogenesis protein CcsA [Candidatus Nitricoxidivorans perseverans]|uniref:Cytochrome c biogenesis protein CcsA n=1 Tax=Candidatus Nitricoxidivorans perseverans TaxID=2975601 RepID=A0AA49ITQ5_9PROT|nr:MAG: cytochrome c biogenesis protein CcsA [Candidatus Nitricoxidivorans perseverans]